MASGRWVVVPAWKAGAVVWPLVGRSGEVSHLESVLAGRRATGLVLAGRAGVGKTRLVHEAVTRAERQGLATLSGTGTEAGRGIPFGALAHLLPDTIPVAASREDLVAAAMRAFRDRAGTVRVMLAVDDAHLLDEHSAVLMQHLARLDLVIPVMSVRHGELAPDPVTRLWKDGLCERLEIHDLSEDEVGDLLETVLGGRVETATHHRVFAQSRGNPLYVRELLLAGLEAGTVVERDGLWRLTAELPLSSRLRELVQHRLGRLRPDERQALELVALAEPLPVRVVAELVAESVLEQVERAGLLVEQHDGRRSELRLAHPLYAEVLRTQIPPSSARGLAAALVDVVGGGESRRRHDRLRLAVWTLDAGMSASPDLLLRAAERALELCDFALAQRFAAAAAGAGAGLASHLVAARALIGLGDPEQAEALLAGVDTSGWSDADRVRWAGVSAYNLAWHLGLGTKALALLESVQGTLTDRAAVDELAAVRAYHVTMTALGRPRDAIAVAQPLVERNGLPPTALSLAVLALGQGLMWDRRPLQGLELLEAWRDRISVDPALTWFVPSGSIAQEVVALYFAGRFLDAVTVTETAYRYALDSHAPSAWAFLAAFVGIAYQAQGREQTALRWLSEGVTVLRETDAYGALPACLAEIAHAHAMLGQLEQAKAALAESEAHQQRASGVVESMIPHCRVWVTAASGDLSLALEQALESAEAAGAAGLGSVQAILLHDAARLGRPELVANTLAEVVVDGDSPLFEAFAQHALALTDDNAEALDRLTVEFETMGAYLLAAEAAAAAAESHRRGGRRGAASAATARASALVDRCEGATSPPLASLLTPLPLTPRQREIATLAARGLSNKQIAHRLVVSPRTVGNHLHDVYTRLGIAGRAELADILLPDVPEAPAASVLEPADRRPAAPTAKFRH